MNARTGGPNFSGFFGGGLPTRNETGDTAYPSRIHSDRDVRPQLKPFDRYVKDGILYRVETRNGELVDIVERRLDKCYGVPRAALYQVERPDIPKQDHSGNARVRIRNARLRAVVRYLKVNPGVTKWDVAAAMGVSSATAWHDLALLRRDGLTYSKNGKSGHGQNTNGQWWAK